MKILLIGRPIDNADLIDSYSTMQSYYLSKSLRKFGIDTIYYDWPRDRLNSNPNLFSDYKRQLFEFVKLNQPDHILALGVNFFGHLDRSLGLELSLTFPGIVAQIHDTSLLDGAPCDLNLTILDATNNYSDNVNHRLERHLACNCIIGFAVDHSLFCPRHRKKDNILRVFVDHQTFFPGNGFGEDYTFTVVANLMRLKKHLLQSPMQDTGFDGIDVRTLTASGIESIDLDKPLFKMYNRESVPVHVLAEELGNSDFFIVTHAESIGMCCLEAASSGCSVIAPHSCIKRELVNLLKIYEIGKQGVIPFDQWKYLLVSNNSDINRLRTLKYSWDNMAVNIINSFINARKRDNSHPYPLKLTA